MHRGECVEVVEVNAQRWAIRLITMRLETAKNLKLQHVWISCAEIGHCFSKSLLIVWEGIWDPHCPCSLYERDNLLEISTPHLFNAYTLLFTSLCLHWLHIHTTLHSTWAFGTSTYISLLLTYIVCCFYLPLSNTVVDWLSIKSDLFTHYLWCTFNPKIVHLYLLLFNSTLFAHYHCTFDPNIVHFNSLITIHLIPKSSLNLFTWISISYLSIIDPL